MSRQERRAELKRIAEEGVDLNPIDLTQELEEAVMGFVHDNEGFDTGAEPGSIKKISYFDLEPYVFAGDSSFQQSVIAQIQKILEGKGIEIEWDDGN